MSIASMVQYCTEYDRHFIRVDDPNFQAVKDVVGDMEYDAEYDCYIVPLPTENSTHER